MSPLDDFVEWAIAAVVVFLLAVGLLACLDLLIATLEKPHG